MRYSWLLLSILLLLQHTKFCVLDQRFAFDALHQGLTKVLVPHHCLEILMRISRSAMSRNVHRLSQVSIGFIKSVDICEACILLVSLQRHLNFVL